MKPTYLQFNCKEADGLDLRQAKAVLKHKPDIVILEYPNNNRTPDMLFNQYSPLEKPTKLFKQHIQRLVNNVEIHPWVKADITMWENITKLWSENHQILTYQVDAPNELTKEYLKEWNKSFPTMKNNWLWWVKIYLREKIMTKNIQWVLNNYKGKSNPKILIFLQSFHWNHVKFLLTKPTKKEIWGYYFKKFPEINKQNIRTKIKNSNNLFLEYWNKVSNF